jgi:ABC-type multidrug transport system ATPase subunit
MAMRAERAERRAQAGSVRLQMETAERSGQMVFEAERLSKAFGDTAVARDFAVRIVRGDRIGLIGPNGSGKTTLLRLLLGEIPPDSGEVRHGANLQIAYYDQLREQLDPERTVVDTIGDGRETVTINGREQHVHGYLRDFLFPPERAQSPVRALSGGERNRLLLARLFTRPANVLVLDEPTNDLDIETLELLESLLAEWPGTLLLVSHDRAFIDNVVTSTLVFEGHGGIREYVGGYEDWVRQRVVEADLQVRLPASRDRLTACTIDICSTLWNIIESCRSRSASSSSSSSSRWSGSGPMPTAPASAARSRPARADRSRSARSTPRSSGSNRKGWSARASASRPPSGAGVERSISSSSRPGRARSRSHTRPSAR